jgi:hypothetical protein
MNKKIDPEIKEQVGKIMGTLKLHLLTEIEINQGLVELEKDVAEALQEKQDEIERLKQLRTIVTACEKHLNNEPITVSCDLCKLELKKTIARLGEVIKAFIYGASIADEALTPEVKKIMEEMKDE